MQEPPTEQENQPESSPVTELIRVHVARTNRLVFQSWRLIDTARATLERAQRRIRVSRSAASPVRGNWS